MIPDRFKLTRSKIMEEAREQSFHEKNGKYGSFIIVEILLVILIFVVEFILSIGAGLLLGLIIGDKAEDIDYSLGTFIELLGTAISTFAVLGLGRLIQKRKPSSFGFIKKNALKDYLIGLVLGFVMFGLSLLICILTGACRTVVNPWGSNPVYLLLLFMGFMIQGNSEEVLCRGHMMVSVSRRYPVIVGLLFNSILFALLHIFNSGISPLALINLFLFGVFMSLLFLKTGSIFMVSAVHCMWNFVQGDVFGVPVSGGIMGDSIFLTHFYNEKSLINGGDFGLEGGLAVTIILIAGIALCFFINPREKDKI